MPELNIAFLIDGESPDQLNEEKMQIVKKEFEKAFLRNERHRNMRQICHAVWGKNWMAHIFHHRHNLGHCTFDYFNALLKELHDYIPAFETMRPHLQKAALKLLDEQLPQE